MNPPAQGPNMLLRGLVHCVAPVFAVVMLVTAVAQVVLNPVVGPAFPVAAADPPQPSTPVQTAALAPPPPGFPNMDGYTDMSQDHDLSRFYVLSTFTSPTGLQCAMWSSRGDTAAFCYGAIPGLDHPANQVYAGDYRPGNFDQGGPPDTDKFNGKPLAVGQKVIAGAGGGLMGGDQITCGIPEAASVACILIRGFNENHGDASAQRHGFVLSPQRSWTF